MSAELIVQPSLTYPLLTGQVEGLLGHGDGGRAVYREAGTGLECGATEVETYLGRCEDHAHLVHEKRGDFLESADFDGPSR